MGSIVQDKPVDFNIQYLWRTAMGRPGLSTPGHSPQQSLKHLSNLPGFSYKEEKL
jgi:hypothetical protein